MFGIDELLLGSTSITTFQSKVKFSTVKNGITKRRTGNLLQKRKNTFFFELLITFVVRKKKFRRRTPLKEERMI